MHHKALHTVICTSIAKGFQHLHAVSAQVSTCSLEKPRASSYEQTCRSGMPSVLSVRSICRTMFWGSFGSCDFVAKPCTSEVDGDYDGVEVSASASC